MFRSMISSVMMLGLFAGLVSAGSQEKAEKKAKEAKITKIDAKKCTMSCKVKGKEKNDPDVDKDFKLAEEIEYMDSKGNIATALIFTEGDTVFIVEDEGKVSKMKMKEKAPTPEKAAPVSK